MTLGGLDSPFQSEMFATAPHPTVDFLQKLEVDDITAKEALKILYELKQKADSRM
jgi:DNA mismatch repair protein MutS